MTFLKMNLSPFQKHITPMKIRKFLTPNTSTSNFDEIMRLDHSVGKLEKYDPIGANNRKVDGQFACCPLWSQ